MSNRFKTLLKVAVTCFLLGFLAYRMDLREFWDVLSSARWALVLLAGLLHFCTVFFSVTRWKTILANFEIHTPALALARITLIGYFFNMFLPSGIGGDFFRAYYLGKREGRGMSTTLTTTIIDRTAGLVALLMIGLTFALLFDIRVDGYSLLPLFLLVTLGFLFGLIVLFHNGMHNRISGLLQRFDLKDLEEKMELVYEGLNRFRFNRKAIFSVIGLSLIIQLLVVVAMWIAAKSIGVYAPFYIFLIFIPIVNLSMAIPITINGVGLRESVYYLLFSQIGVPVEAAVTLGLLNFAVAAMTSLPGGIVYSLYKREEELGASSEIRVPGS
jgi:uncharacterized protein (TIRG00374 family)